MAKAGHTFEDFIADDAPEYARGRWARIGFPSAVHRHVREAHRMSRGYDIDLRPKTARAGSLAPRNRPKYEELQIVIKQFTTRWTSGTEFMAARQGRLGLLRAALGTSLETALSVVFAGNRLYPSGNPPFHTRHDPISIFVLRNNDLGDVLCSTPLFAALRQWFPAARIAAGVGRWAEPILSHNPNVDEVLLTDAPWYNKFVPDRSILAALRYITQSDQVRELATAAVRHRDRRTGQPLRGVAPTAG